MKKSYRRAARRRHVTVRLPIEAVRMLYAAHAEKHHWKGGFCNFTPNRQALEQAVYEALADSLTTWLSLLIANYADDPDYLDWGFDRLVVWLSDMPGWTHDSAIHWLAAHADIKDYLHKDDSGKWHSLL